MLDCNGSDCHSCQGCTHLTIVGCEQTEQQRAEQVRPWNLHELEGTAIHTPYECKRLAFNPKLEAILDLWFLHNSVSMENWMVSKYDRS